MTKEDERKIEFYLEIIRELRELTSYPDGNNSINHEVKQECRRRIKSVLANSFKLEG